jgi:hypothetical protein
MVIQWAETDSVWTSPTESTSRLLQSITVAIYQSARIPAREEAIRFAASSTSQTARRR